MKNLTQLVEIAQAGLQKNLQSGLPFHNFKEAYEYAVLPPGKLFRPLLCLAAAQDYNQGENFDKRISDILKLSSALEIHHSYTLVHDDLPAMDDDDYRRGRLSTHKKYGQWQAILVGDGLLNHSYYLISDLETKFDKQIRKFFGWALGAKGLIQGQYLDLSHEMNHSFDNLIETHNLKTARLIQTSMICGMLMTTEEPQLASQNFYKLYRFGRSLGILFQLIDDLTELTEEINQHEKDVNPWLHQKEQTQARYLLELRKVSNFLKDHEGSSLKEITSQYLQKQKTTLENGWSQLVQYNLDQKTLLNPVMSVLDILSSR